MFKKHHIPGKFVKYECVFRSRIMGAQRCEDSGDPGTPCGETAPRMEKKLPKVT